MERNFVHPLGSLVSESVWVRALVLKQELCDPCVSSTWFLHIRCCTKYCQRHHDPGVDCSNQSAYSAYFAYFAYSACFAYFAYFTYFAYSTFYAYSAYSAYFAYSAYSALDKYLNQQGSIHSIFSKVLSEWVSDRLDYEWYHQKDKIYCWKSKLLLVVHFTLFGTEKSITWSSSTGLCRTEHYVQF